MYSQMIIICDFQPTTCTLLIYYSRSVAHGCMITELKTETVFRSEAHKSNVIIFI